MKERESLHLNVVDFSLLSSSSWSLVPTENLASLRGAMAGNDDRLRGFDGGFGTNDGCTGAL